MIEICCYSLIMFRSFSVLNEDIDICSIQVPFYIDHIR